MPKFMLKVQPYYNVPHPSPRSNTRPKKPGQLGLRIIHMLTFPKTFIKKILNSKLVIMLQYQNTKILLLKDILRIGLKEFLWLKVTPAKKLFFVINSPWCVINEIFYLKKKQFFVSEISRFLCFCEIRRFQNLWRHHKHCWIMKVTLMIISLES